MRVKRTICTLLFTLLGFAAAPAAIAAATPPPAPTPANPVVDWNRFLLGIQATPGDQSSTIHPTYDLAVMHAAIYDAVVSIDRSAQPYLTHVHGPRRASLDAATDAAARGTLDALYPALVPAIDTEYDAQLAEVPASQHKTQGVAVGEAVADELLRARTDDGSTAALLP